MGLEGHRTIKCFTCCPNSQVYLWAYGGGHVGDLEREGLWNYTDLNRAPAPLINHCVTWSKSYHVFCASVSPSAEIKRVPTYFLGLLREPKGTVCPAKCEADMALPGLKPESPSPWYDLPSPKRVEEAHRKGMGAFFCTYNTM